MAIAKTALRGLAAWLSLALLVLGALTLIRLAEAPSSVGGPVPAGGGTAVATGCQRQGPVSSGGVGYFWECEGTVTTRAGSRIHTRFRADELTPADAGNPVGVNEVGREWLRNVDHPFGFLDFVGVLAGLFVVLVLVTSRDHLREMLLFRPNSPGRRDPKPPELPGTTSIFFPVPKPAEGGRTIYLLPGVAGLVLLVMGVTMTLAQYRLGQSGWWGYLVTVPFALLGLAGIALMPYIRRELRARPGAFHTRVDITSEGLSQPMPGGKHLLLRWDDIRSVVFEERILGGPLKAHLVLAKDEAIEDLIMEFRQPSPLGLLLSPAIRLDQAELAAKTIGIFRPGLVSWPAREIDRGGFGIVGAVKRAVVRWKHSGTPKTAKVGSAPTISAKRASPARVGVIAAIFPLVVAYILLRTEVPHLLSVVWLILLVTYLGMLGWSRYQGLQGAFTVDGRAITWSPSGNRPVTVPRTEIAGLWAEPGGYRRGRRYAKVLVVRPDGTDFVLGGEVSPGAVQRVVSTSQELVSE